MKHNSNLTKRNPPKAKTTPRAILRATLMTIILAIGVWQLYQCWQPPPVVQQKNLRYIQLLHTACSSRNIEYVRGVKRTIENAHAKQDMNDKEYQWFTQVIQIASQQQWSEAEKRTSAFANAQQSRKR